MIRKLQQTNNESVSNCTYIKNVHVFGGFHKYAYMHMYHLHKLYYKLLQRKYIIK